MSVETINAPTWVGMQMLEFYVMIPLFWGISYVIGSIPFSYVLARVKGVNLLEVGTKNPGGMNAWRSVHPLVGIAGGLGDVLKATIVVTIAITIARTFDFDPRIKDLLIAGSSVSVVVGHQKSIIFRIIEGKWLGGKGFGCYGGVILAFSWVAFLVLFVVLMGVMQVPKKMFKLKTNLLANVVVAGFSLPTMWFLTENWLYVVILSFLIVLLFWADRASLLRGLMQAIDPFIHQSAEAFYNAEENVRKNQNKAETMNHHSDHEKEFVLTCDDLLDIIDLAAKTMTEWKDHVNLINVFPVPDGDTGTNLVQTLKQIHERVNFLKNRSQHEHGSRRCVDLRTSVIKAGRGNSGLIFTQWLEGVIAECCPPEEENEQHGMLKLSPDNVTQALQKGYLKAKNAITDPKEGTMLTLMKRMAEASHAVEKMKPQDDRSFWSMLAQHLEHHVIDGVKETASKMEALAGVSIADAGAVGFAIFMDTVLTRLGHDSTIIQELSRFLDKWLQFDYLTLRLVPKILEHDDSYCIQCTIESDNLNLEELTEKLTSVGDSLQISRNPPSHRVHVHSDNPDRVLAIIFEGNHDITDIHIENIKEQVQEQVRMRQMKRRKEQ